MPQPFDRRRLACAVLVLVLSACSDETGRGALPPRVASAPADGASWVAVPSAPLSMALPASGPHVAPPGEAASAQSRPQPRAAAESSAPSRPFLVQHRLRTASAEHRKDVALTLDACSGSVDMNLVRGLIDLEIPVTVFVTRRWLQANPDAIDVMLQRPDLFEFENHGALHVPPVIGATVYGIRGVRDEAALREEVSGGTQAMAQWLRKGAQWYRGATAHYDEASMAVIDRMGYRIAGFSVNGDDGATLSAQGVAQRMSRVRAGDIVLAHLNHPRAGTGQGLLQSLPLLKAQGLRFVRLSDAEGVEWAGAAAPRHRKS